MYAVLYSWYLVKQGKRGIINQLGCAELLISGGYYKRTDQIQLIICLY